jgi:hypothetical protein
LGAGVLLYTIGYGIALSGGVDDGGYFALGLLVAGFFVSVVLAIAGIVLTIIKHTRAFGAGLLISMAVGVLCGGGVCVALLTATTS